MVPMASQEQHRHSVTVWAAGKIAERRSGGSFSEDEVPDAVDRTRPAIDLVGHDSIGAICLEHTLIEAYEGQVNDNRRGREVSDRLAERLTDGLEQPGTYTIGINTGDLASLRRKDVDTTINDLEAWARIQSLPVPVVPSIVPNHVASEAGILRVRATLYRLRCSPEDDGKVRVALLRDSTLEGQRAARIRKALVDKLPKLEDAREDGSTTALVLEMNDYVLSNRVEVARVFYVTALSLDIQLPDIVILADTGAGDGAWMDYMVKFGDWWCDGALDQLGPAW
jgi:hypothetical protein